MRRSQSHVWKVADFEDCCSVCLYRPGVFYCEENLGISDQGRALSSTHCSSWSRRAVVALAGARLAAGSPPREPS